ncbi:MAG: penicillin-binding protein activator LpoB [Gammaproteobacteria bacterium]|nr:MAG: penicillin-binding protein activator LpoB [Gammaproteobacteria bacterium]
MRCNGIAMLRIRRMSFRMVLSGVLLSLLLGGCSVLRSAPETEPLDTRATWVMLPFANLAQAPQAGERIEAITAALLRAERLKVRDYPHPAEKSPLLMTNDQARFNTALAWARQQAAQYGVTGSVNEWRYKAGLDGEPAVGVTLRVIDIKRGEVLWTATGARSGWGREGLAMAAQTVLEDLLSDLPLSRD